MLTHLEQFIGFDANELRKQVGNDASSQSWVWFDNQYPAVNVEGTKLAPTRYPANQACARVLSNWSTIRKGGRERG
jgi:hypothetical protein